MSSIQTKKNLLSVLRSEGNLEQNLAKILAISYEPLDPSSLFKVCRLVGLKDNIGLSVRKNALDDYLLNLERAGIVNRKGVFISINKLIADDIMKLASKEDLFDNIIDILREINPYGRYTWLYFDENRLIREIRISLFRQEIDQLNRYLRMAGEMETDSISDIVNSILLINFDQEFLSKFPPEFLADLFTGQFVYYLNSGNRDGELFKFIENNYLKSATKAELRIRNVYLADMVFRGEGQAAKKLIEKGDFNSETLAIVGMYEFFTGNYDLAEHYYKEGQKLYKKESKEKGPMPYLPIIFYALLLLREPTAQKLKKFEKLSNFEFNFETIINLVACYEASLRNILAPVDYIINEKVELVNSLYNLFKSWVILWVHDDPKLLENINLEGEFNKHQESTYQYFQLEFAAVLKEFYKEKDPEKSSFYSEKEKEISLLTGYTAKTSLFPRMKSWERSLQALINLGQSFSSSKNESEYRIIWIIDFSAQNIQAKEQKKTSKGGWTKGRVISFDRLKEGLPDMTPQDREIVQYINPDNVYGSTISLTEKIILRLTGHPLIFLHDNPNIACELIEEELQLIVEEKEEGFEIRFNYLVQSEGVTIVKETPTRYKVIRVTEQHFNTAQAIGQKSLFVPKEAEHKIQSVLSAMANFINIQSTVHGEHENIPMVEASSTIHVHLLPIGDGFQLELYVKPFGSHPPYFKPSMGGSNVITEVNGEKLQTRRDLLLEEKNVTFLLENCPSLGKPKLYDEIWNFETAEDCLEVLVELEPLKKEAIIVVEWPKGERLKLTGMGSFDAFSMNIKQNNNWFDVDGELRIGEDLVFSMQDLIHKIQNSQSRFIQLKDGEFLALTERFKAQLQSLGNYAQETKDGLKFHPLTAFAFDEFAKNLQNFKSDSGWKKQIERMEEAGKIRPRTPANFQATLRAYQKEGFKWLMKLAHWGVGACLADDMGLGKTIQALAAILARAEGGPALVVCPASVRINWQREAEKFAPDLNPIQFGEGDREAVLKGLKPFDLLITSYGLMQQEQEHFTEMNFSTIVLDEAQAIKNRMAKRSKAAMELQGDFKIITTGTPIENHLGELWNLFRFINPGLLGSLNNFQERFAIPIEKYGEKERRESLKNLIQPFVLRRRKQEVLTELPEKTEVTLSVELSPEEKAFYEALRRSALEKLENKGTNDGSGHLQILAEIMRLRQACCNPKLVDSSVKIKSSKLELFSEIVEELLENEHKALVFSQFVQHLKILEKYLKSKGISYQYLDGSTSQKKRQDAIDAFQNGEGDIFLISLKAGGVGLNLTAADYVIHMDPWWNPAVEDQASDRAHRIGQQRPVTIYRLVTEQTIEEKIVNLHNQKRELADSLLSGSDISGKLSSEELMALIRESI